MSKNKKAILLISFLINAIGSFFLVFIGLPGISIPIFVIIQGIITWYLTRKKEMFIYYIPILLLALKSAIYETSIWSMTNIIVILLLYSFLSLRVTDNLKITSSLLGFLKRGIHHVFYPISKFDLPIPWFGEVIKDKSKTTSRILLGILISIPILVVLVIILSSADQIFAEIFTKIIKSLHINISLTLWFRIIFSFITGLYFFGIYYFLTAKEKLEIKKEKEKTVNHDLLIINIVTGSILFVYTIFILIQFRYLFAGGSLPFGLSHSAYARKGFFELLFLTAINIGIIIGSLHLTKTDKGIGASINRKFLYYLCFITIVLLSSSCYRMFLYSNDFGLTRLRLYVFIFLAFELVALLYTFLYIHKQKRNIIFVYSALCLYFYLTINLLPIDHIIAKNLVDRRLNGKNIDILDVTSLSLDASNQVYRLRNIEQYKYDVHYYFNSKLKTYNETTWQSYNYSVEHAKKLFKNIKK